MENNILEGFAQRGGTRLEVEGISGPITLAMGYAESAVNAAAKLTARYSDAPRDTQVWVKVTSGASKSRLQVETVDDYTLESLRIKGAKIQSKKTGV